LVVVSILLGVVINITVAWGLAGLVGVPPPPGKQLLPAQPLSWPRQVPEGWPAPSEVHIGRWWCCTTIHAFGGHSVRRLEELNALTKASEEMISCNLHISQWGWPMRSLEIQWPHSQNMLVSIWLFKRPTEPALRTGLPVSTTLTRSSERTHLPLMPVWPGFVINSLVYATLAGVAVCCPGVVRRAARRRSGRCVMCGYEVAGLARCPECGVPCGQSPRAADEQSCA
jgi:hypothetical protein